METKKIRQLADVLVKSNLSELEIREGNDYLLLKRQVDAAKAQPQASIAQPQQVAVTPDANWAQKLAEAVVPRAAVASPTASPEPSPTPNEPPTTNQPDTDSTPEEAANLHYIESPMVGTFYRSGEPGRDAFVEAGSQVSIGDPVCIIEAMKMMNQISSEISGRVVEVLVENGQPVEFGQRLFAINKD